MTLVSLNKKKIIYSFLLFILLFVLASLSINAAKFDLNQPPTKLTSTKIQAITSIQMLHTLFKLHYKKLPFNDNTANQLFEKYIEHLDTKKDIFTQTDLNTFQAYKKGLIYELAKGDLSFAFLVYNRFRQIMHQKYLYFFRLLKQPIRKINLSTDDVLIIDKDHQKVLLNEKERFLLWDKEFKNLIISLKLDDKSNNEISKILRKRFTNFLRSFNQVNSDDVFSQYLNTIASLFDPHTAYLSPINQESFDIGMKLSLEGIGATLTNKDEYVVIFDIIPGGPAEKTGQLKAGDKIIGVAQGNKAFEDVIGLRTTDVVKLIRGKKNTIVRLKIIQKDNSKKPQIISIVRDKVKLKEQEIKSGIISFNDRGVQKKFGVIDIPSFYMDFSAFNSGDPNYKSTTKDVIKAISNLKKEKIQGLVLDVRNNPGGALEEANNLTGLFIPGGPTVMTKTSDGNVSKKISTDSNQFYSGPLVVLTNRISASASEIFAAAIQDYGRGLIVGNQTYGKGTVQNLQNLSHGDLKFTIGKFYRISGKSPQNEGVIPDIIYPSFIDNEDIGESKQSNSLKKDSIDPISFYKFDNLQQYINKLTNIHDQRIKNDPYFIYIKKLAHLFDKYKDQTQISLNYKKRKKEIQQMRTERLNIENIIRKAKGKEIYKNFDAFDNDDEKKNNSKKEFEKDDILKESAKILNDYINISNAQKAA